MAFIRVVQQQQQSTIPSVGFPAMLGLTQLVHRYEDVSKTELGAVKIFFAKVKQIGRAIGRRMTQSSAQLLLLIFASA